MSGWGWLYLAGAAVGVVVFWRGLQGSTAFPLNDGSESTSEVVMVYFLAALASGLFGGLLWPISLPVGVHVRITRRGRLRDRMHG